MAAILGKAVRHGIVSKQGEHGYDRSARAKVIKLTFVCSDFSATMIPKRQIGLLQIRRNAQSATLQLKR